jgi:ADP-heptose:LPS heptosyltransferase
MPLRMNSLNILKSLMKLASKGLRGAYRVSLAARYGSRGSGKAPLGAYPSILIIRGDGGIGDFVLFLPSLGALRRHYAGSRICLLVGSESAQLASAFADVDEVISFDVKRYRRSFTYRLRLIRQIRKKQFSMAINPIHSREPSTDELLLCCGAQERIASSGDVNNISSSVKRRNDAYCSRILPSRPEVISEVERNREFVEQLTDRKLTVEESLPRIALSETQMNQARQRLLSEGVDSEIEYLVVLFPGASNAIKRWPAKRFADLASRIDQKYKARILICGAPSDLETQEAVASKVSAPVVRLAGKTDLLQLIAILKHAALYIGNDTGPLHLAAAVGTPTLCILGGGHFGRFYPYGDQRMHRAVFHELECFQCNWVCPYEVSHCIHEITVQQAWQAVQQMFDEVVMPSRDHRSLKVGILGDSS